MREHNVVSRYQNLSYTPNCSGQYRRTANSLPDNGANGGKLVVATLTGGGDLRHHTALSPQHPHGCPLPRYLTAGGRSTEGAVIGAVDRDSARDAQILARVMLGERLTEIAKDYRVSPERIRQLANRAGSDPGSRKQLRHEQAVKREAAQRATAKEQRRGVREAKAAVRKAAMLEHLRHLANRLGRVPTNNDLKCPPFWFVSYYKHFGSLRNAQALAGLRPNRRGSAKLIEWNGHQDSIAGWARRLDMSPHTLWVRLANWPIQRALTEPVRRSA